VTVGLELAGKVADDDGMMASTPRADSVTPSRPVVPLAVPIDPQGLVDGILARPLFASTRRPTAEAPSGPAPVDRRGRLTP